MKLTWRRPGWPLARILALATAQLLVIAAIAIAVCIGNHPDVRLDDDEYNLPAWEVRNLPSKWLYAFGNLFRTAPTVGQENETLLRFFALTHEISLLETAVSDATQRGVEPDAAQLETLRARRRERDKIENQVEATIEGRITRAAEELGVTRSLPLLPDVWPPVDLEFTDSPRSLATSRRDRIELIDSSLLREDLSIAEIEAIEARREEERDVSALAFPTGGIGAYPTIVNYTTDYRGTLELAAHEWTHNYLFFSPLGFNYYDNNDIRTMNETVADLVGREIAAAIVARWPISEPPAPPPSPAPSIDVGAVLRQTRMDVDALLADGKIEAAEALMKMRRQELVAQGVRMRKLNQAYFAFVNLYAGEAGSPAAVNPIGPKIDELRHRSPSLKAFVGVIGGITSVQQLDAALEATGDASNP